MTHADGPDLGPAAQRILLGAQIRAAREARGMTTGGATDALAWKNAGKLSKIEAGTVPTSDGDVNAMIDLFGIPAEQAGPMRQLAAVARRKLPPSRVPEFAARYVHLVGAARELRLWLVDAWPGSVQTVDYARAIFSRSVTVAAAEVDRRAEERARRVQNLYATGRAKLWLVVGELALDNEIGGPDVLRGQLERVRELAELDTVTVQVMPRNSGAHPSHGLGSFSIITVVEGRQGLVYVENLTGSDYLGREHVTTYELAFRDLQRIAMDPETTMEAITRRIEEL